MRVVSDHVDIWFFVYDQQSFAQRVFTDNKLYIQMFGFLNHKKQFCFNDDRFVVEKFYYETELEERVNEFVGEDNFYREQMEAATGYTAGPSGLYPEIIVVPD